MFRATFWLTLATVAGLLLGFAREWLIVAAWGAGERTDAFVVAMFLPEALRMTLAAGLLAAAALPLYQQVDHAHRQGWLSTQLWQLLLAGSLLAALVGGGASLWVTLTGPGMGAGARQLAASSLQWLALTMPLLLLHALAAVVAQARERFFVAGLGSLFYNLPAVGLLLVRGAAVHEYELALAFVLGAVLMWMSLLPLLWREGWRPWQLHFELRQVRAFYARLGPLLASASASQGLVLIERVCASWLGEGAITLVNLARKLVNLPLVALMSLNQVLLSKMARLGADEQARRAALKVGLVVTTALTVPAAAGMIGAAPVLVDWLLPAGMSQGPLPWLLAWFAAVIVFGAWNALLARYAYAAGDTVTPLRAELAGSTVNAAALLLLPWWGGMAGIAWAALLGCVVTGGLLLRRYRMLSDPLLYRLPPVAVAALLLAAGVFYPLAADVRQFVLAAVHSLLWLVLIGLWGRRVAGQLIPARSAA